MLVLLNNKNVTSANDFFVIGQSHFKQLLKLLIIKYSIYFIV